MRSPKLKDSSSNHCRRGTKEREEICRIHQESKTRLSSSRAQAAELARRLRSCSLSAERRSFWEREALIALRLWRPASRHRAARRPTHAQTSNGGKTFPTWSGWQLSDTASWTFSSTTLEERPSLSLTRPAL